MTTRHALSLCLILTFAWCEETQAFSSLLSRPTTILPSTSSLVGNNINDERAMSSQNFFSPSQRNMIGLSPSAPPRLQRDTRIAMTMDGSSDASSDASSDDSSGENKEATTKKDTENQTINNEQKSNAILMIPLFCKFMVVLLIKFLTDLVVFPSLFIYRLARRTKRKLLELIRKNPLFGSFSSSYKPNGISKN